MRLLLAAFAALLLAVAPNFAHAADINTIDCIAKDLPAPTRAAIVEKGRRAALADDSEVPGLDASLGGFRAALKLCTDRHQWSDKAAEAASIYTISQLILEGVLKITAPRGITAELVGGALARLTRPEYDALIKGEGSFQPMIDALADGGYTLQADDGPALVGAVAGALLKRDAARATFIAS